MPSKNPRIALTLPPHRYELLKRLSGYQGTTMAGLVTDTLEMLYPVFERVCVVLEAAAMAQESGQQGLRDSIAKAEADMLPMLYEAASQFDLFVGDAAKAVGADVSSLEKTDQLLVKIMSESKPSADKGRGPATGGDVPLLGTGKAKKNPRPVIRGSGIKNRGVKP